MLFFILSLLFFRIFFSFSTKYLFVCYLNNILLFPTIFFDASASTYYFLCFLLLLLTGVVLRDFPKCFSFIFRCRVSLRGKFIYLFLYVLSSMKKLFIFVRIKRNFSLGYFIYISRYIVAEIVLL